MHECVVSVQYVCLFVTLKICKLTDFKLLYHAFSLVCFKEPKSNLKQLVAPLMGAAAKGAEEANPTLREAAMGFMVAFTARVRVLPMTLAAQRVTS